MLNSFFCPQLGRDVTTISCRFARTRDPVCIACEGWLEWQEKFKEGIEMSASYKLKKTCGTCGKPVCDGNTSGYCFRHFNQVQKSKPISVENETNPVLPETTSTSVETIAPIPETIKHPVETMPIGSLGAAKLAIDRAFQDAERFQEAKNILSEIKSLIIRFEQVTA